MGTKSKFFRAFVEGQTISDGRKIDADWIDQIVETFNTETYPEIFDDWSKRYVKTPEEPNAAADAYLAHARGFDLLGLRGR